MISFSPVHDIPLRFNSLNLIFSAPTGRIHPFFVNTTTGSRSMILQTFGRRNFSELLAIKDSIFGFFQRAKAMFLSPVFTENLGMLILLE